MMEDERVCCMCGDVGFPDKIFRCIKCQHRFQHSYCSNDYSESSEPTEVCEWCRTAETETKTKTKTKTKTETSKQRGSSKKPTSKLDTGVSNGSEYSGDKIKQHDRDESNSDKGKSPTGAPSPRTATRRYKLLKDVMC
ncbi:putative chromatin regulator PHD family [Helianthus annuus]|nr:putative chromatin regulator PHD family [Helianthus annuus]